MDNEAELSNTPTGAGNQADTAKRVERLFTAQAFEQFYDACDEIIASGWGTVELVWAGKKLVGINVKRQIKVV